VHQALHLVAAVMQRLLERIQDEVGPHRVRDPPADNPAREDINDERLSPAHLYVVSERGEDWFAAMRCPCGCGATVDLNLVRSGVRFGR